MSRFLVCSTLVLLVSCGGSSHNRAKPIQTMNGRWDGIASSTNSTESVRIGFNLTDTDTSNWRVSNVSVLSNQNCYQNNPIIEIKRDDSNSSELKIRIDIWPDSTKTGRHLESHVSLYNNDTSIISGSFSITNSAAPCTDFTGNLTLLKFSDI